MIYKKQENKLLSLFQAFQWAIFQVSHDLLEASGKIISKETLFKGWYFEKKKKLFLDNRVWNIQNAPNTNFWNTIMGVKNHPILGMIYGSSGSS